MLSAHERIFLQLEHYGVLFLIELNLKTILDLCCCYIAKEESVDDFSLEQEGFRKKKKIMAN